MSTKLGAHIQRYDHRVRHWLEIARPPVTKWMEFPAGEIEWYKREIGGITIGRIYTPTPVDDPDTFSSELAARVRTLGSLVDYWELWNEAASVRDEVTRLARSTISVIKRLRRPILVGSFSEGNPRELNDWPVFFDAMRIALEFGGGLALHEYDAPRMTRTAPWRCGRYRLAWDRFPDDLRGIPIFITELGIDGGIGDIGRNEVGFRGFVSEQEYLADLQWYDAMMCQDDGHRDAQGRVVRPNVVGGTIFTVGNYHPWESFDVVDAIGIASYIGSQPWGAWNRSVYPAPSPEPSPEPSPPPPPPPKEQPVSIPFQFGFKAFTDAMRQKGIDPGVATEVEDPTVTMSDGKHLVTKQNTTRGVLYWFSRQQGEMIFISHDRQTVVQYNGGALRVAR